MVAPCKCTGSHRWVHADCLRQWQHSVQIGAPNHPQAGARERRHTVCSVCAAPYQVAPEGRAQLLARLAALEPSALGPGTLLVAGAAASAPVRLPAGVPPVLRLWMEIKRAHWARGVYLLYRAAEGAASDGDDALYGLNLTRPLAATGDSESGYAALRGVAGPHCRLLDTRVAEGKYQLFNGGPIAPREWVALCAVPVSELPNDHSSGDEESRLEVVCGPSSPDSALVMVVGTAGAVLALKPEHASFFSGHAVWSRTQLLGECARGSWGVGEGTMEDALPAADAGGAVAAPERLHATMLSGTRVAFAPRNEMRDAYEAARGPARETPEAEEARQRRIGHLVGVFENLRRQVQASPDAQP
eukprot:TRINITY_DN35646_c0_g1_i1.p2 TRINITY_DN35646_c0_g1~~TRINITY_DN35646_c0_g1_i1.p2  ORF type:complete len:418 (+),score=126.02 TRINITY_DN35646_c0_g1_i1:180-1256(+)